MKGAFNSTIPDTAHPAVAQLTGSKRTEKTHHISQGCMLSGSNGGLFGDPLERHHRPEKRHQVLHSFC